MKPIKYILIVLLSFNIQIAISQTNENKSFPMEQLKFIGTWQWESHDSVFTIKIDKVQIDWKKFDSKMPDSAGVDEILIGWHELTVMGKVVESNMNAKNNSFKYEKRDHMIFWNTMPNNDKEIRYSNFKNISKRKSAKGVFIIQPDNNNKAMFILYESSLAIHRKEYTEGFTVPNRIIMTRIK